MSVVSLARYRIVTLDTTSSDAAVTAALDEAEGLVEDHLRRPLALGTRTEKLLMAPDRRVYPSATPIVSVDGGLTIEGDALLGATPTDPFFGSDLLTEYAKPYTTVTYTGGYDADTLPKVIERAVCVAARTLMAAPASVPAGATSVRVGDVSVTYGPSVDPTDVLAPMASGLRPYRRRFV